MKIIELNTNNVINAVALAINCAGEANDDNFNSVCLRVYENSTFKIVDRCYSNAIYAGRLESTGGLDFYDLTVSSSTYPVADKPFSFLEFCVKYQVKLNN